MANTSPPVAVSAVPSALPVASAPPTAEAAPPAAPAVAKKAAPATKICFVIRPMGPPKSPIRLRSEQVQNTYINPACVKTGYDARSSDRLGSEEIGTGIVSALSCAPMTIAYLGSPPWNDDVMVEVGYRLASGLPLVIISDAPKDGETVHVPKILEDLVRTEIPPPGAADDPELIDDLVEKIQTSAWGKSSRLESHHPIALIHSHTSKGGAKVDSTEMHYIAASEEARELFGIKEDGSDDFQLVGHTLKEYLDNLQYRMSPQHYEVFRSSQDSARTTWSDRIRKGLPIPPSVKIPIVFNRHRNPEYVGRAYLPIIVSEFRSEDKRWCNLKVLYLEVTAPTEGKTPQPLPTPEPAANPVDPRYFTCSLAGGDLIPFDPPPDPRPIGIFISYNSLDRDRVEQLRVRLVQLGLALNPWLDRDQIDGADNINQRLTEGLGNADSAFVCIGKNGPGKWQNLEVDEIIRLKTERGIKILPVFLDGLGVNDLPKNWMFLKSSRGEAVERVDNDKYLKDMFASQFGERFYI